MQTNKVRKAVIPAAGLGTRVLPATKSMPKEMLPIVDLLEEKGDEIFASADSVVLEVDLDKEIVKKVCHNNSFITISHNFCNCVTAQNISNHIFCCITIIHKHIFKC